MRRLGGAVFVGAVAGLLVALLAGAAFDTFEVIGKWGTLNGAFAGVIAFLAVLGRGASWPSILARWLVVAVVALVTYGITWWTVSSRIPPWAPDGAWLWSATLGALGGWLLAVRWAWRGRTGGRAGT